MTNKQKWVANQYFLCTTTDYFSATINYAETITYFNILIMFEL